MKPIQFTIEIPRPKLSISLIIVFCLALWMFNLEAAVLLAIFSAFIIYRWDSRILAGLALILLLACFIFMIFGKENIAETIAIYAYYFLVMVVVLQIVECIKDSRIKRFKD